MTCRVCCRLLVVLGILAAVGAYGTAAQAAGDDLLFIHHSSGDGLMNEGGMRDALSAKPYVDEVNEINYGDVVAPDPGRPGSLGGVPGDLTDMWNWIWWFNDYFAGIHSFGCDDGVNRIIMFKSCFPNSDIMDDGAEPGDPSRDWHLLVDYQALYRHPDGPGNTYTYDTHTYRPLEDIFASHPEILFINITAPSRIPAETCVDWADRARVFNNWLKNDWLSAYNAAHPDLHNVAVFDWFDILTYPANHTGAEEYDPANDDPLGTYPVRNMTKIGYRTGDSHPGQQANIDSAAAFATQTPNFIDQAFALWENRPPTAIGAWHLYR